MVRQISPPDLAQRLQSGQTIRLVDVRQAWESRLASLPNSKLIPLNELPQRAREIPAEPESMVVVYCHHGIRSQSAATYLEKVGYVDVASLTGGIDAWSCEVDPATPRY